MLLEWVDVCTRECETLGGGGGGGAGALRVPNDSNRAFPVMSTFNIVLAALETLRHMLDFKSSDSVLLRIWVANLWLGDLDNHICHKFC